MIQHKDFVWPVSPEWAAKHLDGRFAEMAAWSHEACWDRLWALLRKSDETFGERTAGMTIAQVQKAMRRKRTRERLLATLTAAEMCELRAAEAHVIVRNRADFLLGRELAEFGIEFIDHAHGQGCVHTCGCDLLSVMDDRTLDRRPHYPRNLCSRHGNLWALVHGARHNAPLAERLACVHETIHATQEAQPAAAAA